MSTSKKSADKAQQAEAPTNPPAPPQKAGTAEEVGNEAPADQLDSNAIDQVRNILFGAEIRQQKEDTVRLEGDLKREIERLREEHNRRLNELTELLREQITIVQDSLRTEATARQEEDRRIEDLLRQLIEDLDTRTDKAISDLNSALTRESTHLNELIEKRNSEQTRALNEVRTDLDHRKSDRSQVASILKAAAAELERGL